MNCLQRIQQAPTVHQMKKKEIMFSLSGRWLTLWSLTTLIGGRTAPLTSELCILYIYSTSIGNEYFKDCMYSLFFTLQNAVCFIILTYLVPVLFTFYIQDVLKLKKNSGAKRLKECYLLGGRWRGGSCVNNHDTYFNNAYCLTELFPQRSISTYYIQAKVRVVSCATCSPIP